MSCDIFISYRRSDVPHAAVLLHLLLSRRLPLERLFIDVAAIEPGDDFVNVLSDELRSCKVLVTIIGPDWLDARDAQGRRRLERPNDYVRFEIEAALRRNLHIVPVLIGDTPAPDSSDLPPSLAPLARLNAIRPILDPSGDGVEPLARKLEKVTRPGTQTQVLGLFGAPKAAASGRTHERRRKATIFQAARELLEGKLPPRITRILAPDLFLMQDPHNAISQYRREPMLSPSLPYVEIVNWCNQVDDGQNPTIEVVLKNGRFELASWGAGENAALPLLPKPKNPTNIDPTALFGGKTIAAEAAACLHYSFMCFGKYR